MFIESPSLNQIDLSYNEDLINICRSSFVRHEHLQQGEKPLFASLTINWGPVSVIVNWSLGQFLVISVNEDLIEASNNNYF